MRAQETTVGSPVLRLTTPPETATSGVASGVGGYAVAETIMRSAVHAKGRERPEPTLNGARPNSAAR